MTWCLFEFRLTAAVSTNETLSICRIYYCGTCMNNALGPSETATTYTTKSVGSHTYESSADFKNNANIGKYSVSGCWFLRLVRQRLCDIQPLPDSPAKWDYLMQCIKLVKFAACPVGQVTKLLKVACPLDKLPAHNAHNFWFWHGFTKMALSPLIIVRFEKFKNWHQAGTKPILWGGLGPRFFHPQASKPAKDGRTGSILHTDWWKPPIQPPLLCF